MPLIDPIRILRKKRVLVTGGSGFLGVHLVPELRKVCGAVALYNKDVRSIDRYAKKFDIVCHLAGIGKVPDNGSIDTMFDVNCCGTLAVMHYCRRTGAICVFASSSAVYAPIDKNWLLTEDAPTEPVLLYGVSKLIAENICRYDARNFGVSVIALRIFNMYGPGQQAPFIVPYIVGQLKKGRPVVLKTPAAVRDIIFVQDVARAFISACAHQADGFKVLNVGTGVGVRIYDLAKKISHIMKATPKISAGNKNRAKEDFVIAGLEKIKKTLDWEPIIPLDEGIRSCL